MQKEAKAKIKALVDRYELAVAAGKVRKYTEEETKNAFIKPLFEALGWDFSEKDEVSAEENIVSSGRVDYGFYINSRAKFYLEAKKLKADLNSEEFARQAIRYSFNKGVTWAVLTDFESIKVFNAQALSNYLGDKLYFEINYLEYLERLDQLWLLSKEAFEADLIDREAEKAGKKLQKVPVTELLYKDLNECRRILTEYLGQWNPKVAKDLLDEGVQKLLDRLIFIRVAEDRKIEQNILIPLINQWRTNTSKDKPELYESMANKFRELDDIYNSNLFSPHPFEKWEDDGGGLERVIKILHGKSGYYEYDFSVMPADVLGSVYENYLGHKLSQSKKGLTLDKTANKRKEQGIYYTPTFIVDYIVRNALKPVLDKCRSINDLKKIKVLDPACGSGSFLIKALEVIAEKYKYFDYRIDEFTKIKIILENLYGVDLDEQAVEIARLNLLINALEEKGKLPSLDKNIKNGNSLISGTDEELEKYFGKNFRDKKPFNWQEEFPEVFKQGGFDAIIGNPPYIQLSMEDKTDDSLKRYLIDIYNSSMGRLNTFGFFMKLGIDILRDKGYLGYIIPNTILTQDYYKDLRAMILKSCSIANILSLNKLPFKDATVENIIIILEKTKKEELRISNNVKIFSFNENMQLITKGQIDQKLFVESKNNYFNVSLNSSGISVKKKIEDSTKPLNDFLYINQGIALKHERAKYLSEKKLNEQYKPLLDGRNINRYQIKWEGKYLIYDKSAIHSSKREDIFLSTEKILFRRVGGRLISAYDNRQYYTLNTIVVMNLKEGTLNYNLKYFLALFNSKLINFYYKSFLKSTKKVFSEIQARQVAQLPIRLINFSNNKDKVGMDAIVGLANRMINLNMKSQNISENSNEWHNIKSEIEKTDKKIDEEVYKLYDLTPEEIAIVQEK